MSASNDDKASDKGRDGEQARDRKSNRRRRCRKGKKGWTQMVLLPILKTLGVVAWALGSIVSLIAAVWQLLHGGPPRGK